MALGASTNDVLRMVVGEASTLALAGIVIGLALALAMTRVLRSVLYGVATNDPISFGTAAVALLAIALATSYVPARRATRIDPATALKTEWPFPTARIATLTVRTRRKRRSVDRWRARKSLATKATTHYLVHPRFHPDIFVRPFGPVTTGSLP
jgi:hypothetical protein